MFSKAVLQSHLHESFLIVLSSNGNVHVNLVPQCVYPVCNIQCHPLKTSGKAGLKKKIITLNCEIPCK